MDYLACYQQFANWIVAQVGGDDKLAHMVVGLMLWMGSAILLRRSTYSLTPLAVVIAAEAMNECLDRVSYGSWRWTDSSADIAATLAWPVLILLAQRRFPFLCGQGSEKLGDRQAGDGDPADQRRDACAARNCLDEAFARRERI